MEQLDVRIVKLEPMRVASAHGFGEGPETLAWDKLIAWAKDAACGRTRSAALFGSTTPIPPQAARNYAMKPGDGRSGSGIEGEITVKEFRRPVGVTDAGEEPEKTSPPPEAPGNLGRNLPAPFRGHKGGRAFFNREANFGPSPGLNMPIRNQSSPRCYSR